MEVDVAGLGAGRIRQGGDQQAGRHQGEGEQEG
jgi:hypothetical protein